MTDQNSKGDIFIPASPLTNQATSGSEDEISLRDIILGLIDWIKYLLSKWKIIVIIGLLGGVAGYFYAKSIKTIYTAESTFVLEDEGPSGGLGQYSGMAAMVGLDLGGGGGGIFQKDNIIELYKSRTMIEKTLLSPLDSSKNSMLLDRFLDVYRIREAWNKDSKMKNINFSDINRFTRLEDSVITALVKKIRTEHLVVSKPDKKLNIISVRIQSEDELFSKEFADRIVTNVNNFYVETKAKKSLDNLAILQFQADSVKSELLSAISGVASSTDANPNANPSRLVLRVPSQKRQVDAEANKAILTEIVKNLEMAKISVRKEMPLIQVIDSPVYPLSTKRPSTILSIIVGGILSGFAIVAILVLQRIIKNFKL
jgi:hypothetical protein